MSQDFEDYLAEKLSRSLEPSELIIRNDSALHQHHEHAPKTMHSHFHVRIVSPRFIGLTAVQRHRLVYQILEKDLKGEIHALSLDCQPPSDH